MKTTIYLCLCGLLFLNLKCKNALDELPPETQDGSDTFAFLLNGEVWQPDGRAGLTSNLTPYLEPNGGVFNLSAYRIRGSINQGITLAIRNLKGIGVYKFDGVNYMIGFDDMNNINCHNYIGDDPKTQIGTLEITKYDMKNYIVSGRFEAKLFGGKCGDTLKITQGRFDIKF